ncbi:erythromycin esterase family protein [Glycomyces albidus]|uniref:Erythromycin esterase family protein n=1 Tax=Glycomyces albidus TaxID=2656774 RepID=A0A6L5G7C2_9ACTN|nr:erythromycin esterase family protein [Glycomyces albidus]MQM25555.1 hypothetical protein [Glycomyces albidus]
MSRTRLSRRVLLSSAAAAALAAGLPSAAQGADDPVVAWIDRRSRAIDTTDPAAGLDDLEPLRRVVGAAPVVGLGEWSHGSREQFRIKHRMVRFLVERMGFRTIAFEQDFAHGIEIDRYVRGGDGDAAALVRGMSSPLWATQEIVDLIEWMRARNDAHPHRKVRFFGADLLSLRESSFTAMTAYVEAAAPDCLDELTAHLDPIRPTRPNQIQWYLGLDEETQQSMIADAKAALALIEELPSEVDAQEREYAEQHARAVIGWHEYYAVDPGLPRDVREVFIADAIQWWQRVEGGRTAYWAANIHTSAAASTTYATPAETTTFRYAGGHLRHRMGRAYRSIGTVFGEGVVNAQYFPVVEVPVGPPPEGLLDATLGRAKREHYLLDLHADAPEPVRRWREGPVTTRMIHPDLEAGQDGAQYVMSTDPLIGTFDAIAYLAATGPSTLLD